MGWMEYADLTYSWRATGLFGEGHLIALFEGVHLEGVVQRGGSLGLLPDISSDLGEPVPAALRSQKQPPGEKKGLDRRRSWVPAGYWFQEP